MSVPITVYDQIVICKNKITGQRVTNRLWSPIKYDKSPDDNPDLVYENTIVVSMISNTNTILINKVEGTSGSYRNQQFVLDVPKGPMDDLQIVQGIAFPYNVRIVGFTYIPTLENIGDQLSIYVVPSASVGKISKNAISKRCEIEVDIETLVKISCGMEIILDDGVNVQNVGECLETDYTNLKVTVVDTLDHAFKAGTSITIKTPIVKDIIALDISPINFGIHLPGNKLIPKGHNVVLEYMNRTAAPKKCNFRAEMLV